MRQIVLDTETTGLDPSRGHRIIEIGCVELINRRLTGNNYHQYILPDREIDAGAIEVHGITNEFLADKPRYPDIAADFIEYVKGAELIIHNAPFDAGFLNAEFVSMDKKNPITIESLCRITDTLKMARTLHPGQKNSLDALCKRYEVDNSSRALHGALLDSEILADVYLAMTGGQTGLFEDRLGVSKMGDDATRIRRLDADRPRLPIVGPTEEELAEHRAWIAKMDEDQEDKTLWTRLGL
ncbi:MAG: DNA polymerase III subunit epsilon [Gammaproteobacteria bacterium]|nr:MAG: DNA polymerase III subunit epsilon [Gammaproteobacteria bacterium]